MIQDLTLREVKEEEFSGSGKCLSRSEDRKYPRGLGIHGTNPLGVHLYDSATATCGLSVVQEIALARRATVYCGTDMISWKKFAVAVELFVEVETATHRLSEVMKKDPKFYHVPGWFEYVSALGASLLVEATGKLFRDYEPDEPREAELGSDIDSDTELGSEPDSPATSESDFDPDIESESHVSANKLNLANKGQPLLTLEYLVSSLSIFDVTEPHDAVYALLAIAKDTNPYASDINACLVRDHTQGALQDFTQKKRYQVDYEQPYSDVCKEFVKFCIEQSDPTRALDIICRPWAPEAQKVASKRAACNTEKPADAKARKSAETATVSSESTEQIGRNPAKESKKHERSETNTHRRKIPKDHINLLSWIPQLTGAAYAMLPQAGVHTLKMGRKNADTLVGLPSSSQSLQRNYNAAETKGIDLKTLRFRKREAMGHHSLYVKGFMLDTVVDVQASSQRGAIPSKWARAAGWRHAPLSDPPDEFWRTLVADRGRDGRNPLIYYSRACKESFIKGGFASGSVNTTDLINNERCSVVAQFCRRVQSVIWNRCLIKTLSGRLGLASQNAQPGDLVCILYGCSVPVLLRRKWKSVEDVHREVDEDVKLLREKFEASCRNVCNSFRASKLRRQRLRREWLAWDADTREKWKKDTDWHRKWQKMVSERKTSQDALGKDKLTERIKSGQEKLGYLLKAKVGENDYDELEESYQWRLQRKSYIYWKKEMKEKWIKWKEMKEGSAESKQTKETIIEWNEPSLRWRQFELWLHYGRRWKKIARKKIALKKNSGHQTAQKVEHSEGNVIESLESSTSTSTGETIEDKDSKMSKAQKEDTDGTPADSPKSIFTNTLREKFLQKFKPEKSKEEKTEGENFKEDKFEEDPEDVVLESPEQYIHQYENEEVQRFKQNWCYYEVLGEYYEHGMMNGEAMAYQNDKKIKPLVFELR